MPENGRKASEEVAVRIERIIPEDMRSTFANHIVVQNSGHGEFHISFFEIHHPMLIGESSEIISKLKGIESVRANCVSRIVVSDDRMKSFIAALVRAYGSPDSEDHESGSEQHVKDEGRKHVG